jgi:serine/threonine protein kinase
MVERVSSADRFGLVGSTLAGRYYVERQVAEGGFAVVYRAYQALLDRFVALKVLKTPPDLGAENQQMFQERFAAEARTIARLKHPYIVSVYDFGVDLMTSGEPAPWMTLEWLDGETLEADLDRRRGSGGRGTAETVQLFRPIIDALAYAHRQGIVHRDIKPANIMIVPAERGHVLRTMDFGISKMMRAGQHDTTKHTGTSGSPGFSPHYASPEQVTFSHTGPWTDVHALGLVMTEMLTDQPPYSDTDDVHIFEQVMAPSRPTPRSKGKRLGQLGKVIEKAVALSPRQRWQSAGELLAAIDSVVLSVGAKGLASEKRPKPDRTSAQPVVHPPRRELEKQVVDRIIAAVGSTAILMAFAILVWTLRPGRPGMTVLQEFARAAPGASGPRAVNQQPVEPWVVPLPPSTAPAPTTTTPSPTASTPESSVVERRQRSPSEVERIKGAAAHPPASDQRAGTLPESTNDSTKNRGSSWVDPFADGETESHACRITVNSIPWAEVWIDGKNTTQYTPLVDYQISCGHHRIEFRRADLHIDQIEPCILEPGQPFKRRYTLTPNDR